MARTEPATPTPAPLSIEDAKKLLDFFDPKEVATLLEMANATHHGGPDTRAKFHRDPATGIYTPEGDTTLTPNGVHLGHEFTPLPIEFDEWAESDFYVPDRIDPKTLRPTPTVGPLVLMPWQRVVFRFMLDRFRPLDDWYSNLIISTLKKSGKTLAASAIGRFITETFGFYSEVIFLGADKDQAEDKLYAAMTKSIELSPAFDHNLNVLFGLGVHPDDPDPANPTIFAPDYSNPRWRLRSDGATHIPNHGTAKAVPRVYKKLAGGNQTAAIFTEMWTWTDQTARRLFDEMTPPPTRPRSVRIMEGYAGFEGESGLWEELWDQAMNPKLGARMVTREELEPYGGWPFPPVPGGFTRSDYPEWRDHSDPIPLYVNPSFSICALIDQGEIARRMPWQTPRYYESQRNDESYDRHHLNIRSAHKEEFVPKHWWDACNVINHPGYVRRVSSEGRSLPPVHLSLRTIPPLLPNEPIVLSGDASVNNDCTVLMALSYATWWDYLDSDPNPLHFTPDYLRAHPEQEKRRRRRVDESQVMVRRFHIWEPTKRRPMNYTTMYKPVILSYYGYKCLAANPEDPGDPNFDRYETDATMPEFNVLEVAYDRYMIHDLMINLRNEYGIWIKEFSQNLGRDVADNDLYVAIRDRTIWHGVGDDITDDDEAKLDSHRANAARRVPKVANSNTAERRHLDKKSNSAHIDLLVVLSMGAFELKRLEG